MDRLSASSPPTFIFGQNEVANSGLPVEIIIEILSFLDANSLISISKCSKKLNDIAQTSYIWEALYKYDFPEECLSEQKNWKTAYKTRMQRDLAYLQISFPGERGIFHVDPNKNWQPHYSTSLCLREMVFVNEVKGSIISNFRLRGYENGEVGLFIPISSENIDVFLNYLKSIDPAGELKKDFPSRIMHALYNGLYLRKLDRIKKFFRVIAHFNTLPPENLQFMRKIIWSENWTSVTPLSEKEKQEIEVERIAYNKGLELSCFEWFMGKIFGYGSLLIP